MYRIGPKTEPCGTPWQTGGLKGSCSTENLPTLPCNPPPHPNIIAHPKRWSCSENQTHFPVSILTEKPTAADIVGSASYMKDSDSAQNTHNWLSPTHTETHTCTHNRWLSQKDKQKHSHTILLWSHTPPDNMSIEYDKLLIHNVLKHIYSIWCCSLLILSSYHCVPVKRVRIFFITFESRLKFWVMSIMILPRKLFKVRLTPPIISIKYYNNHLWHLDPFLTGCP